GHWSEGRNFLERALAESKGVPAAVQVKALITAANLANMQTDSDRAEVLAEKSRELCQELGDTRGLALSLRLLAVVATKRGDLAAARSLSEIAEQSYPSIVPSMSIRWRLHAHSLASRPSLLPGRRVGR